MAHRTIRKALTLLPAVALIATATGCAQEINTGGESQAGEDVKLVKKGQLTTCTHLPYPPFQSTKNGKIVGFDVDLIDLVAKELGVKQKIVDIPFAGIESGEALNTGQCDVAAAAMTITDKREKVMDFSNGYFAATQSLLVRKDVGIGSLKDMKGKKLGVQLGTTGEDYAKEHKDEFGYTIVHFEDLALMQTAVVTGKVDAAINDDQPNKTYAEDHPEVSVTKEFGTGEHYGFAVRTGNGALLSVINDVLKQAKADGTYAKIYKKWFDGKPPKKLLN